MVWHVMHSTWKGGSNPGQDVPLVTLAVLCYKLRVRLGEIRLRGGEEIDDSPLYTMTEKVRLPLLGMGYA